MMYEAWTLFKHVFPPFLGALVVGIVVSLIADKIHQGKNK